MPNITLSGKTFQHKETIKSLGGKWDGAVWMIRDASDATIAECRALIGVGVTVAGSEPAPAAAPAPVATVPSNPRQAAQYDGNMLVYGDAPVYGPFAHGKPRVYAGFSSLDKICAFVNTTPNSIRLSDDGYRGVAWQSNSMINTKSDVNSMNAAMDLAHNGWIDGVEKAKRAMAIIEAEHVVARHRINDIAGGRVNVGRMLSGNPVHMSRRARQPATKVITLYVSTNMRSHISVDTAIIRAAIIAAISDILEASGFSCEIVTVAENCCDDRAIVVTTVVLKQASDPLNLNDVVFGLGHPAMQRRLVWAVIGYDKAASLIFDTMGYPGSAFNDDHPTEPGSFYIDKTETNVKPSDTFETQVRKLFPLIVPDNFPVSLK